MMSLFPIDTGPRYFFVDMNSFYASVEQEHCEAYRGKPLIVVPMLADTTCALAASYEAKALGIKTGTSVRLAKIACPALQIVEARPELYLHTHARLVEILNDHFASVKVLSIDEMACRVPPIFVDTDAEDRLARQVKTHIYKVLGPYLRCSVGIAPNVFLSKVAAERQKPDGLTIWNAENLPEALFDLKLRDLPGIGSAMRRRLAGHDITTVQALWDSSPIDLRRAWGSVVGERWYYMLRGSHQADYQPMQASAVRKSVSHSHVLAPAHRSVQGATSILLELFAKALKRLRAYQQVASALQVTVRYRKVRGASGAALSFSTDGVWVRRSRRHLHANDEVTWLKVLRPLLEAMPDLSPTATPYFVCIVFSELLACQDLNLSLFEEAEEKRRLALVVDDLQRKYGNRVDLAALQDRHDPIPLRIPFGVPESRR